MRINDKSLVSKKKKFNPDQIKQSKIELPPFNL